MIGLLDSIRNVFGWRPPLVVRDQEPLGLTGAARARLAELPPGHAIHVETIPVERGRVVRVVEGECQGPPPPELDDLPITISNADLSRLRGRLLDWRDERWAVQLPLDLRARETPNPDSRLYLVDHTLGTGRPAFFAADATGGAEALPDLPARLLAQAGIRSVLIRDNTVTVEREPGTPWDPIDAAVNTAVREHLILCGEPLTGHGVVGGADPLEDEIRAVLTERIAPAIHRDGGDVELIGFSNGVVKVSMVGACRTCPSSTATLRLGIERTLMEAFPGQVLRVEQI